VEGEMRRLLSELFMAVLLVGCTSSKKFDPEADSKIELVIFDEVFEILGSKEGIEIIPEGDHENDELLKNFNLYEEYFSASVRRSDRMTLTVDIVLPHLKERNVDFHFMAYYNV